MIENQNHSKIEIGSEKNFGIVFGSVFLLIGIYQIIFHNQINVWPFIVSLIFFIFSLFIPRLLIIPNKIWHRFGMLLALIIAPIVMSIIYFLVMTPIGVLLKLSGKDVINKNINPHKKTYWIRRTNPMGSMTNQY